jgi:hypothetical protein
MRGPFSLRALAFLVVLGSACVVRTPPPPEPAPVAPEPEPTPRTVELEDGSYIQIAPGLEPGFTHCCGDSQYMMEIDCSERLMRCYQKGSAGWKQTYGKHCKSALGQGCYLHACNDVCDAYTAIGGPR